MSPRNALGAAILTMFGVILFMIMHHLIGPWLGPLTFFGSIALAALLIKAVDLLIE